MRAVREHRPHSWILDDLAWQMGIPANYGGQVGERFVSPQYLLARHLPICSIFKQLISFLNNPAASSPSFYPLELRLSGTSGVWHEGCPSRGMWGKQNEVPGCRKDRV